MRGVQRARVRRRQAMEAVRCQSLSHSSTTSPRSTADDGQMTKAERRREEIETLHVDFKRLTEQLAEANAAKCEALVRSEDIAAKEIALKHKESSRSI